MKNLITYKRYIRVPLEPAVMIGGRNQQIEAAVKELMK